MSKLTTRILKLGDSVTESENLQLRVPNPPDGTFVLEMADGTPVAAFDGATGSWSGSQTSAPAPVTGLTVDLTQRNSFTCTVSSSGTLTFTGIAARAGQSGWIRFNISGTPTVSAHANTKISAANLTLLGTDGNYLGSYYCDGTDVWVNVGAYV